MPPLHPPPPEAVSESEPHPAGLHTADLPPCGLAATLLAQARRWLDHTHGHLAPTYAAQKLVESLQFSARRASLAPCVRASASRPSTCLAGECGKGACQAAHEAVRDVDLRSSFAVPTKLNVVSAPERQDALRRLADTPGGLRLHLVRTGTASDPECITVYAPRNALGLDALGHDGAPDSDVHDLGLPLGQLQPKHVAWVAPLVGRGAYGVLLQVSGGTPERPTRGVNIALAGLDTAIRATAQLAARRPSRRAA